jgi:xylulokinase
LRLLPYFNGERTPALPKARATLSGMNGTNFSRANVCRAAMEGATLGLRYGLDVLRRQGIAPKEIRLVGGGARSRVWRQIVADVFNCPVVCPTSAEAGAMGGVLQAMWCVDHATGGNGSLQDLCAKFIRLDSSTRAEPAATRARTYDAIYAEHLALNTAMAALPALP